jgi:hypothetical protein
LVTPVRIVCANTQSAAIARAAASFGISHTGGASVALQEARRALKLGSRYMAAFEDEAAALYAAPMDLDEMRHFAAQLVDVEGAISTGAARNRRDTARSIVKLWVSSPTVAPILRSQVVDELMKAADHNVTNTFATRRVLCPRNWLEASKNETPRLLKKKAAVGLHPKRNAGW